MLPFLKKQQEGSMSGPIEVIERTPDEGSDSFEMLDAIAEDIIMAVEKKDKSLLKSALESLCDHIQSMDEIQDASLTNKEV